MDAPTPSTRKPSSSTSTTTSTSSSCCSSVDDYSFVGPATPLRFISRIPFSWEHFPGIPKNPTNVNTNNNMNMNMNMKAPSHKLLPLPPPTTTATIRSSTASRKKNFVQATFHHHHHHHQRDPFFAAFIECSKSKNNHQAPSTTPTAGGDGNTSPWNSNNVAGKVSRSVSDRFQLVNVFASCKRTCAVSRSMVRLPTSRRTS